MKKNEYVSPEMEVIEITEKYNIMEVSSGDVSGELKPGGEFGGFDD